MIGRATRIGTTLGLLALLLAGCGVRGALDNPNAKSSGGAGAISSSAPKEPGEPVEKPRHRDFFLDGLIR